MASTRLSDAQRQELVARYQQGETAQALAEAFGCSAATVTRVVKAAIGPERYEQIKLERGKGLAGHKAAAASPTDNAVTSDAVTSHAAIQTKAVEPHCHQDRQGEQRGPGTVLLAVGRAHTPYTRGANLLEYLH